MKLKDYICEGTYDLSFVQNLYDYIYGHIFSVKKQLNTSRYYDITTFFNNQPNPFDRKVKLHIRTSLKNAEQRCQAFLDEKKEKVVIELVLGNRFENVSMLSLKRIMRHEITHAIDLLRMDYYKMGQKRFEKYNKRVAGKGTISYRKDEMEVNAFINLIPSYRREFPKSWESITTYEKMLDVLSKGAGFGSPSKEITNNKDFRRSLLARLHRENLLPPNLKL